MNGQAYTYDANGSGLCTPEPHCGERDNLLADGTKTYTYTYNNANRLTQVVSGADTFQYLYNGLGDRLQSILNGTATTYSLDLNSGLTQVLADGTNIYTYGFNRIAQVSETQTGYFLGDAHPFWCGECEADAYIATTCPLNAFSGAEPVLFGRSGVRPGTGRFVSRDTWAGITTIRLL